MKLEEFTRTGCWVKRELDVPGNTPEEIKDNYLDGNYDVINKIVDSVDDDPLDEVLNCKLQTILGDEIWTNEYPDRWDVDDIIPDDLEYQSRIKNIFI